MIEISIQIKRNNIITYDINAAKRIISRNFNVDKNNIKYNRIEQEKKDGNIINKNINNSIFKPNEDVIYFYFNIEDETIEQNIFDIMNKTKQELGNALGIKPDSLKINTGGIY